MFEQKSILVMMDQQEEPQIALERGKRLAANETVKLHLLCVVFEPALDNHLLLEGAGIEMVAATREQYIKNKKVWLDGILQQLKEEQIQADYEVVWQRDAYRPAMELLENKADQFGLVIKTTYHHSVLNRFFVTHTDWHLIRESKIPLLLVKAEQGNWCGPVVVAVDPTHTHDKPGKLDKKLIQSGKSMAKYCQESVRALHCYELLPPMVMVEMGGMMASDNEDYEQGLRQQHQDLLNRLAQETQIPEDAAVMIEGPVEERIVNYLEQAKASMLVMGAVARSSLDRFLLGSTAERIIDQVHCDILIVKP